jgi:hypothetical protein
MDLVWRKIMSATMIKAEARKLVDKLPKGSTWDDLIREIYVHEAVELGLEDAKKGRVIPVEKLRAEFGLPK